MASGYTCCIDFDKLNGSKELVTSIDDCLKNKDLSGMLLEIENYLKNVNFEHSNSINYKDSINASLEEIEKIKKEVEELKSALETTVREYRNVEELNEKDLRELSEIYEETKANINNNITIKVATNSKTFQNNIDDSIKDFMMNNNLTDYPKEYESLEKWQLSLKEKYKDFKEEEQTELVEKDMAVWRHEQSSSSVTTIATSEFAEHETNINVLKDKYRSEYGLKEADAKKLATLKENYNILRSSGDSTYADIEQAKNRLDAISSRLDYRKTGLTASVTPSDGAGLYKEETSSSITKIPPVTSNDTTTSTIDTPQVETHQEINTVPIGLGIAATGIAASVGAVVVDSINDKKRDTLEYYHGPDEYIEEPYKQEEVKIEPQKAVMEDSTPYHATRDQESINKFYGENNELYEEEE